MSERLNRNQASKRLLDTVFEAGFRTAARWARREDLLADTDSPAYRTDRDEQLGRVEIQNAMHAAASPSHHSDGRPTPATLAVAGGVKASVILRALNAPGGNVTLNQPLDAQDLSRALAAAGEQLKGTRPAPNMPSLTADTILIRLHRPEGYEDVHPDLILQDAKIDPAFMPELAQPQETAATREEPRA